VGERRSLVRSPVARGLAGGAAAGLGVLAEVAAALIDALLAANVEEEGVGEAERVVVGAAESAVGPGRREDGLERVEVFQLDSAAAAGVDAPHLEIGKGTPGHGEAGAAHGESGGRGEHREVAGDADLLDRATTARLRKVSGVTKLFRF